MRLAIHRIRRPLIGAVPKRAVATTMSPVEEGHKVAPIAFCTFLQGDVNLRPPVDHSLALMLNVRRRLLSE